MVDLEFGEQSVEAVDLLLLFNEGVVLGDTTKSKFVHEVDFVGVVHVLVREVLDGNGEGCGEKHDLAIFRVKLKELFNNGSKFGGEEFVRFIHDELRTFAEVGNIFSCQVENSSWCADNNVYWILETKDIISQGCATSSHHNINSEMLA